MTVFSQMEATEKLTKLAEKPFDLTSEKAISAERIKRFSLSSCGYQLLYATERVTEEVMDSLFDLAEETSALEKMAAMQNGEVINYVKGMPSEERSVLHTATRDFFDNPNTSAKAIEATKLAKAEVEKLRDFIVEIDKENRFTDMVIIGIGGSYLGPLANYLALQELAKPYRQVHFIANVDPDDAAAVMNKLELKNTLVVIISKTGTTLETRTNEEWIKSVFADAGLDPKKHMVTISMKGSPLDDSKKYRACFYIWDWVGGRYSSTSMVGGLLIAFACGFEVYWDFLRGANAMDKAALNPIPRNLPLTAALIGIWNRNFLRHDTLAIIPYSQALSRFPAHIQQLDMESNGKRTDQNGHVVSFETGPIIWGEIGTNAQHSFFQLLHQGTTIVPIEFIGFNTSQYHSDFVVDGTTSQQKLLANLLAQIVALAIGQKSEFSNQAFPGNRPSHLLFAENVNPYTLGALLAFYEHKVAFQGFIWGINSFDQEGVQLGKKIANSIIKGFTDSSAKQTPIIESYLKQLNL